MLEGTDVRCETRITSVEPKEDFVLLEDEQGFTWEAEAVILTCPIPQLFSLFSERAPPEWEQHPYASNWTLICTGYDPIPDELLDYSNDSIELMRRGINDSNSNVLIVQMANAWSKKHLERTRDEITDLILQEVQPIASAWFKDAHFHAHRWRFSRPINRPTSFDNNRITFAGDAWAEPIGTIEAALNSAEVAALELVWKLHYAQQTKPITMQTTLF